ncbi:MAG: sigma-70 family RNA polymerase sigma factor [Pyrinomonadaceae bacterium]
MLLGRSITFDDEGLGSVAGAAPDASVYPAVDSDFVEKLKLGEAEAFDRLITQYSRDVYSFLFRSTGNAEDASDLTQETFLKAFRSIAKFRGDSELKTWLFRIAINESRNRFRWWKRRKREFTVSLDDAGRSSERPIHESIAVDVQDPEQSVLSNERLAAIKAALVKLPEKYRTAVILCDIEGLTYEEIASTLDINAGTVKSRIARGRDELRRTLKDF